MNKQTILVSFGHNVKNYRTVKRYSLHDLCGRTGLSKGHISQIEHGLKNVTLCTVYKLAEGLGVKMDELLS